MIAWLDVPGNTHKQRSLPIAQIAYFYFYRVKLIQLGVDAVRPLALNRFWIAAPRSFGSTRADFLNH
jgi:hypothetical protein